MSETQLKRSAKKLIDQLSEPQLYAAQAFLTFLSSRSTGNSSRSTGNSSRSTGNSAGDKATRELLGIPGFAEAYARGLKDVRAGRTKNWRDVRDDVQD